MKTAITTHRIQAFPNGPGLQTPSHLEARHTDGPERAFDGPAPIIDVSTFLSEQQDRYYLTVMLSLSSIEEGNVSPNQFLLDDRVGYDIHVVTSCDRLSQSPTFSYQFQFKPRYMNQNRLLQTFLGMIQDGYGGTNEGGQIFTVTRMNHYQGRVRRTVLGTGLVSTTEPEPGICELEDGHRAFVGLWNNTIDIDLPPVFRVTQSRLPNKDSQNAGHQIMMILQIPVSVFGGTEHIDGVYATKISSNWRRVLLTQPSVYRVNNSNRDGHFDCLAKKGTGNEAINHSINSPRVRSVARNADAMSHGIQSKGKENSSYEDDRFNHPTWVF